MKRPVPIADNKAGVSGKRLRRALDAVMMPHSVDVVLQTIVREARSLAGALEAELIVHAPHLTLPEIYTLKGRSRDPLVERRALDAFTDSVFRRAGEDAQVSVRRDGDPLGRIVLEAHDARAMASVRISSEQYAGMLLLYADEFPEGIHEALDTFAYAAGAALNQSRLFTQLEKANERIGAQNAAIEERNRVIRDIVQALDSTFRTPLFAARLSMHQALEGNFGPLPEQYRQILETALAGNADQRRLIETLLLVARFETGDSSTLREEVDVLRETLYAAEELRPLAHSKGVLVSVTGDSESTVLGDASELRRAIANVIANAIRISPLDARVDVHVSRSEGAVELSVEDSGASARSAPNGHALDGSGFYLVRLIAQKLGGSVTQEPRAPRGRIVTLRFPSETTQ